MVLFRDIVSTFESYPGLLDLNIHEVSLFIDLCLRLWHLIKDQTKLPPNLVTFFSDSLSISPANVQLCWSALYPLIAENKEQKPFVFEEGKFREHNIPSLILHVPYNNCLSCARSPKLNEKPFIDGTVYTMKHGALPGRFLASYCRYCQTVYYGNYRVREPSKADSQREYYGGLPEILEVSDHKYVERKLCEFIKVEMALCQVSANRVATLYNESISKGAADFPLLHALEGETILDIFVMHSLIEHNSMRGTRLFLPHRGLHRNRLTEAIQRRNLEMAGTGQEMWAHRCGLCCKWEVDNEGTGYTITAGVTDGITIGHPCCSVHDCKVPLGRHTDRFCPQHFNLTSVCCINDCNIPSQKGFATCEQDSHREYEINKKQPGRAFKRMQSALHQSGLGDLADGPLEDLAGSEADKYGSARIKGKLYRSWTHNEQLFVKCCGIILSRATFYGSEAVSSVAAFLKVTFPPQFPHALPNYTFFDNNCQLRKHLIANQDTYFDNMGMPVDVFHFETKHKKTDVDCQTYCNPSLFPQLRDVNGKWIFNSSMAESVNNWFGQYQSVVREMNVDKYNFFLDECITERNRRIFRDLEKAGHYPHLVPLDVLQGL